MLVGVGALAPGQIPDFKTAAATDERDLALQLDVAMEAEHEEYLRRPDAFETPVQTVFHWTHAQMADSVAWLANRRAETAGGQQ